MTRERRAVAAPMTHCQRSGFYKYIRKLRKPGRFGLEYTRKRLWGRLKQPISNQISGGTT